MGINLGQYLDDWLTYLTSRDQCLRDTVQVLSICHTMGLLIHAKVPVSGISIRPDFLPCDPNIGSTSQDPGAYVADPVRFVCDNREISSSGSSSHPGSPALHLALGFQSINKRHVDPRFPCIRYNGRCQDKMF